MSDEDALLAAIATHPEEDTPRLMYADWLDEHARSIRAEFIRGQIEIARVEHLPRAELNRYVGLVQRNQELIDNHRSALLGPGVPSSAEVEFRRGFAWEVTLSVFHFHQSATAISTMRPPPRIAVRDSAGVLREFLGINVFRSEDDRSMPLVTA